MLALCALGTIEGGESIKGIVEAIERIQFSVFKAACDELLFVLNRNTIHIQKCFLKHCSYKAIKVYSTSKMVDKVKLEKFERHNISENREIIVISV